MGKMLFSLVLASFLCACSSAPMQSSFKMQSSFNGNSFTSAPTSIHDPHFADAKNYMEDGESPTEKIYENLPSR